MAAGPAEEVLAIDEFVNICLDDENAGELENVCHDEDEDDAGVYRIEPPNTEMMVSRTRSPMNMIKASFIRDRRRVLFVCLQKRN